MVVLEEARKIVQTNHPNEWIYQIAEYKDCYQFWLLPKGEAWGPAVFVVDTPIVDKMSGKLNDNGTALDKIDDKDYTFYDYRNSNDYKN